MLFFSKNFHEKFLEKARTEFLYVLHVFLTFSDQAIGEFKPLQPKESYEASFIFLVINVHLSHTSISLVSI